MPIKGLTDSARNAFPCVGKLRKGGAMVEGPDGKKRMGPDLDYFRFTSERPEAVKAFVDAYGEKPAQINVFLPHPTIDENFSCWKEKWVAGGLVHRCDGEMMTLWLDNDGTYSRTPKPCDSVPADKNGCKAVGRLSVWIPELIQAGLIGYVTCETHGLNDVLSIQGSLLAALEMRGDNPKGLVGIQWVLKRVKEKISTPMQGKRVRREKWLVKLEPAKQWVTLQLEAARRETLALPAPKEHVDPNTGEITEQQSPVIALPPTDDEVTDGDWTDEEDDAPAVPGEILSGPDENEPPKSNVEDMRVQIEALIPRAGSKMVVVEKWCSDHLHCSYADATLDGLTMLRDKLAEMASKKAAA